MKERKGVDKMTELEKAIVLHGNLFELTRDEAKADAESIIQGMEKAGMTREFAENTFIEDTFSTNPEELAKMEKEAKKVRKNAKAVNAYGKTVERKRKPNENKRSIIVALGKAIKGIADSMQEVSEEEEHKIDFTISGIEYTVTLTAHRKTKKE